MPIKHRRSCTFDLNDLLHSEEGYQKMRLRRSHAVDFLKGSLILLVVYGHAIQFLKYPDTTNFFEDPIFRGIYMFHMPLFMAVSGYLFFSEWTSCIAISSYVQKRTVRLLLPMGRWVVIIAVMLALVTISRHEFQVLQFAKASISSLLNRYWFIWALMFCGALTLVLKACPIKTEIAIIAASLLLIALPLSAIPGVGYTAFMFSFTFPFFCLGLFVARRMSEFSAATLAVIAGVCLLASIFLYSNWQTINYSYANKIDVLKHPIEVLITFLGAASASVIALAVLLGVYRLTKGSLFEVCITTLGGITLQIYLAQEFVFTALDKALDVGPMPFSQPANSALLLAATGAVVIAIALVVLLCERNPKTRSAIWARLAAKWQGNGGSAYH